jgi:AcrR family transcriptional regulator
VSKVARLTRAESRERTRMQLLAAAEEVFAARGFHGASLDEVAEAAGYSKGAVYSNFASKDELFVAVLRKRMSEQAEFVTGLGSRATGDTVTALPDLDWMDLQWCQLLFEFWLYALRNSAATQLLAEAYRQFRAQLAPIAAVLSGPELTPQEVASAAIALYQSLALQRHLDPDAVPADLAGRILTAFAPPAR